MPAWKREADFLLVQISFDVTELLEWRASIDFDGPVFAGVIVLASAAMAAKLPSSIPELAVPDEVKQRLERDGTAGVEIACETIDAISRSGAFAGVHLIPVARYPEMSARLELMFGTRRRPHN